MYRIEILQSASDNIDDIGRYIAAELKNKTAAERLTDKIYSAIETLATFPYAHTVHQTPQNEEPLKYEYRKILVDNYFVFYRVDETQFLVIVSAVIYARRRLPEQLRKAEQSDKPQKQ